MENLMIIFIVYIFTLGLIVGSFLNVCIYRIPEELSIVKPPSSCPKCKTSLKILDLIPVFSYLFLKRKCRYCKEKISPRYMLIELTTGLVFVILFMEFYLSIQFIAFAFLMSILIVIFFTDIDHMIIPNGLVITGLVGGVLLIIYNVFIPFEFYNNTNWWTPILGMFSSSMVLLLIGFVGSIIYKSEAMGGGDIKIFLPIGIFLGWKMALLALFISVIISGIPSLILILLKKRDRKATIPLGPFIVVGTFTAILFGREILNWYMSTLTFVN